MAEYIEREKVIRILNDNIGNSAIRSAVNGYPEEYFDGWTDAASEEITEVEDIPAADVRPERHGEWLVSGDCYECSECGGGSVVNTNPYCWKCGASLKAANFICEGEAGGTIWTGSRKRDNGVPQEMKQRYVYVINRKDGNTND